MPILIDGVKKNISKYRLKYGMSLWELADKYGFSTSTIMKWERDGINFHDRVNIPRPTEIRKTRDLCTALSIARKVSITLGNIKQRCNNPNEPRYKYYGGKGIKTDLTLIQLMYLWERDKADKLSQPSIDRIDPLGNYTLSNCRFIEMSENARRRFDT